MHATKNSIQPSATKHPHIPCSTTADQNNHSNVFRRLRPNSCQKHRHTHTRTNKPYDLERLVLLQSRVPPPPPLHFTVSALGVLTARPNCPYYRSRRILACKSPQYNTLQEGVARQSIGAVHSPRHLSGGEEPRDRRRGTVLSLELAEGAGFAVDSHATHGVVDCRCDDGDVCKVRGWGGESVRVE